MVEEEFDVSVPDTDTEVVVALDVAFEEDNVSERAVTLLADEFDGVVVAVDEVFAEGDIDVDGESD